jgi:hypothetical protein
MTGTAAPRSALTQSIAHQEENNYQNSVRYFASTNNNLWLIIYLFHT